MKRVFVMAAALMVSLPFVIAQDTSKVRIKPYGFVRSYLTFDSRKTYYSIGGEYNMIPYDIDTVDGVDLNEVPSMQLQALSSRFGVDVTGPKLCGWSSSGRLEGDFGGFGSTNTVLRLRLAYVKLTRGGSEVVVGQDWHPLSGSILPEVLGMAAGAPFRPHSRTPQVRATHYWGSVGITSALMWQLQYMNNGPRSADDAASAASTGFAHNALWPEAFLGVNLKAGVFYMQMGVDAQILRPRTHAVVNGVTKKVDERVASLSPTVYFQMADELWSLRFRTLLAQNTSHLNQLVGYAVTGINEDGSWSYSPMNASISYLNIAYGKKVRCNLFLGYMKNLGAWNRLYDFGGGMYRIYMKGAPTYDFTQLNSVWRVAPSVSYNVKAFNIGLEYEVTACTYGELGERGQILLNERLRSVTNHRVCAMVKYNF